MSITFFHFQNTPKARDGDDLCLDLACENILDEGGLEFGIRIVTGKEVLHARLGYQSLQSEIGRNTRLFLSNACRFQPLEHEGRRN